jgi:GT2 family glycosyltransferase
MNNVANKNASLEILVSTKGQDNTDFINRMFKNCPDIKSPVLIVNQSKKKLNFPKNNCRVINTNEIGLSNSRNLAINNSKGEICLLSDDDVIYSSDFVESIKNSFEKNKNAEIITYQATNELGKLFKDYPKIKTHNKRSISIINSFLIAFRRDSIIKNKIQFDSKFGLGSTFETGDEYIFLRNALEKKLNISQSSIGLCWVNFDFCCFLNRINSLKQVREGPARSVDPKLKIRSKEERAGVSKK